jgi:hypothetical protein
MCLGTTLEGLWLHKLNYLFSLLYVDTGPTQLWQVNDYFAKSWLDTSQL